MLSTIQRRTLRTERRQHTSFDHFDRRPPRQVTRTVRVFDVLLSCGCTLRVPFSRRPKVGKRMVCVTCTQAVSERDDVS